MGNQLKILPVVPIHGWVSCLELVDRPGAETAANSPLTISRLISPTMDSLI